MKLTKEERINHAWAAKMREQNWMEMAGKLKPLSRQLHRPPESMKDIVLLRQTIATVLAEILWRSAENALADQGIVGDSYNAMIRESLKENPNAIRTEEIETAVDIALSPSTGDVLVISDAGTKIRVRAGGGLGVKIELFKKMLGL